MPTIEYYFNEIDSSRARRIRELSEIKRIFRGSVVDDPFDVRSKALVVLSYAVWEGFYNECVDIYCRFLENDGKIIADVSWNMLVGALTAELNSLRDRHHSMAARLEFVDKLKTRVVSGFDAFDESVVMARSNLDFKKLQYNFRILNFEIKSIEMYRNQIDKELVGWRHGVAHGDSPQLPTVEAAQHIALVGNVMALVADAFQEAMLVG